MTMILVGGWFAVIIISFVGAEIFLKKSDLL